jgi:hypothetical protein
MTVPLVLAAGAKHDRVRESIRLRPDFDRIIVPVAPS